MIYAKTSEQLRVNEDNSVWDKYGAVALGKLVLNFTCTNKVLILQLPPSVSST